jgi:fumarate reductase flavoprotein subunit
MMLPAEPADVAVVGGGMAGLVAANRCAQLGLRTVLLEKGAGPDGDSNARISTGLFHLAWHPLDAPAAELEAALVGATDGDIEPGMARAIAASASRPCGGWSAKASRSPRAGTTPRSGGR